MPKITLLAGSINPPPGEITLLKAVPSGKTLPPFDIRVNNTGDQDWSFQCFRVPPGETPDEGHAVGGVSWVGAGVVVTYLFKEFCGSRDGIYVRTNCTDESVKFSMSALIP